LLSDFGYIGLLFIVAIAFSVIMPLIPLILALFGLAPHKPTPEKTGTYECGVETIGKTWIQFNFRYYFYALLFVVFDILIVFLFPWATGLKQYGAPAFAAVIFFLIVLMTGYVYAWVKKALEWK
jgi:NADH-quinone oxidoreductase subunit A